MAGIEFRVGELIENRYRVLSVISLDRMGVLYRVSDEARGGELVALKTLILDVPVAEVTEQVKQFRREFQILTQLRHPNLVTVYDYGITTEGELYFTMEWIEGQDLDVFLRRLEPATVTLVIVQVCRALAYLHARGVVHGDLKPSNVLMAGDAGDAGHAGDRRHRVKIVDFGVALETRNTEVQARYYTPGYTAPEVKQRRLADQRADLYSLGAMWYALLVGEPPVFMPEPGKERLIQLTLEEALGTQGRVPAEIGAVIVRLMAMSPADRYGSANEVIEAVNEITGSAYVLETQETARSYALRARFVDRVAEIEMLRTLWEQAQADEGKLVLVSGEGGVGKTRLVEEFVVQAALKGARVARGQCVEGGGIAYRPWREVLRVLARYVEGANGAGLEVERAGPVLATLLPELWERDYMQGLAPPADLEPQAARLRLNDSIVQVLRVAAEIRPTVIVIEDAQWADEATLELLRFLARSRGQAGLQVCVTYRDDQSGPARSLAELAGSQIEHIPLRRLPPEITTDLVCSMLGLEQLPASLMERVQRTTEGNAFFVQELIRSLAEDGVVLQRTVEGWRVDRTALQEVQLPESIRQVAWQRLIHLSMEARQVLCWAATVGPLFWDGVLEEIGRVPRERVQTALGEGLEGELIFERDTSAFEGQREFLFAKPAVQEVGYESVVPSERREAHWRVATWLIARREEEVSEHLGLIADHLESADQTKQAIIYLKRAGEQAAAQFANVEAVTFLSRALDLTSEDRQVERYDLLLVREKVYHLQGAREVQVQDQAALQELADALDDDRRRTEVALRRADYAEAIGDYPAVIAAAQMVVHLAQAAQDVHSEAQGHLCWGLALWRQGKYKAARIQLEQALSLARTAGLRKEEAVSLNDLGVVSSIQGDAARAKACLEQALGIYREIGERQQEGVSFNNLGNVFCGQGNYAEGRACWEQALYIAREIGDRRSEGMVLGNLGDVFARHGDYAEARVYYEQSLRIFREVGDLGGECLLLSNLGLLFHHFGDDEAARKYGRQALLITQEIGDQRIEGFALTNLGHALVGLGRLVQAAESYRQALALWRELSLHNLATEPLAGLACIFLAQEDLSQAQVHVEEILDHLESGTLDGTEEPFWIYLTCYRVLHANQDPRVGAILNTAHRLLQEQVAKIGDEKLRRSFLEKVAAHREIVREFAKSE